MIFPSLDNAFRPPIPAVRERREELVGAGYIVIGLLATPSLANRQKRVWQVAIYILVFFFLLIINNNTKNNFKNLILSLVSYPKNLYPLKHRRALCCVWAAGTIHLPNWVATSSVNEQNHEHKFLVGHYFHKLSVTPQVGRSKQQHWLVYYHFTTGQWNPAFILDHHRLSEQSVCNTLLCK